MMMKDEKKERKRRRIELVVRARMKARKKK